MATYNFDSTGSTEYLPVNLSASEEIVFHVTNSNEGSSYFTIETYPDNNGAYSSNAPKNTSGSFVSSSGITTIVSDDYHMSAVVENGGGTITFAPADFVSGSDLKVRGVGAKTDYASTIDRWPNAAAAYSLRRLNSYYDGPAVKVRRSVDSEEKDINFIGTSLDTTTLETFCSGGDGYVTTWYDQSGNDNHATQGTAADQPVIVSGSQIYTLQGQPALHTFSSSLDLSTTSSFGDLTWYVVSKKRALGSLGSIMFIGNSGIYGGDDVDSRGTPVLYSGGVVIASSVSPFNSSPSIFSIVPHITYYNRSGSTAVGGANLELNTRASGVGIGSFPLTNLFKYIDVYPQYSYDGLTSEIILYSQSLDDNRFNLQSSINSHYKIYWDGATSKLINTYSGSAAAYSLRALNQEYTGSLIRVRRSNNNDEINIGADYEGNLDTNLLEQFCDGTDGFVTTWYDQSGNGYHQTQGVAGYQPQIVSSGNVLTLNNKPTVYFDRATVLKRLYNASVNISGDASFEWIGSIDYPLNLSLNGGWSYLFGVGTYGGTTGFVYTPYTAQATNDWQPGEAFFGGDGYSPTQFPRLISSGSVYTAKTQHSTFGTLGSVNSLYINNNLITDIRISETGSIPSATGLYLGGHSYGEALTGSIQEFILYNDNKTSIREGFESNINSYYNIY